MGMLPPSPQERAFTMGRQAQPGSLNGRVKSAGPLPPRPSSRPTTPAANEATSGGGLRPATVVVGREGLHDGVADLLCDDTNAREVLQEAVEFITLAVNSGSFYDNRFGQILILDGFYGIDSGTVDLDRPSAGFYPGAVNLHIRGMGAGATTIECLESGDHPVFSASVGGGYWAFTNVSFEGLQFNGSHDRAAIGVRREAVGVYELDDDDRWSGGRAENFHVRNCRFEYMGTELSGTDETRFVGAIDLEGLTAQHITISNNYFLECTLGVNLGCPIEGSVIGNTFQGVERQCIRARYNNMGGGTHRAYNLAVIGNAADFCGDGAPCATFFEHVNSPTEYHPFINSVISDNAISFGDNDAVIRVGQSLGLTITGNAIEDYDAAVAIIDLIDPIGSSSASAPLIANNDIEGYIAGAHVRATDVYLGVITGNQFQGAEGAAIWLDAADGVSITANSFIEAGYSDDDGNGRGVITITGSVAPHISANKFAYIWASAIWLDDAVDDAHIGDNQFWRCDGNTWVSPVDGVVLVQGDRASVLGNAFYGGFFSSSGFPQTYSVAAIEARSGEKHFVSHNRATIITDGTTEYRFRYGVLVGAGATDVVVAGNDLRDSAFTPGEELVDNGTGTLTTYPAGAAGDNFV